MSNTIFKIDNKAFSPLNIELLYATKSKFEDDWHSIIHSHPFTEIFYILKGDGAFLVKNKTRKVNPHDIVIIDMLVDHTEISNKDDPLEYIVVGISGLYFVAENMNSITEDGFFVFNTKDNKNDLFLFFKTILKETSEKKELYNEICQNLASVLVFNLKRLLKENIDFIETTEKTNNFLYIKKYIDINYHKHIDLDALSNYAHINKYYLVRIFKKEYGVTPIQYLIDKRIEISKTLLKTTNHTIGQISDIVGFNSQSYFNQVFIKKENLTPSDYRQKFLNE